MTTTGAAVLAEVTAEWLADALHRLPNWNLRDEGQEEVVYEAILARLRETLTRLPDAVRKLDAEVA